MLRSGYEMILVTADWEGFCLKAGEAGVSVYEVLPLDSLTYGFSCGAEDFPVLKKIAEKQGDHLTVRKYRGLQSLLRKLLQRPVLVLGGILLLFLFLYLPSRVLFLRVTGNDTVPSLQILEAASQCGIRFGASGKKIRSEEMKNSLLEKIPGLSWAGINIRGCVAEIAVKEQQTESGILPRTGAWSITAGRDGIITSDSTVRKGQLLCHPGQAVYGGQVLISGLPTEENPGNYCAADGDIYAVTLRTQRAVTPAGAYGRGEQTEPFYDITLILGKKRIKIYGSSGNQDPGCGRMYSEYYITLPGGFRLPIVLAVSRSTASALYAREQNPGDVRSLLRSAADRAVQNEMLAGSILKAEYASETKDGLFSLEGTYLCHEMIGRIRQEKIGVKQDTWKES